MGNEDQKRQRIKRLLTELHKENRYLKRSMISALGNVRPRHLLDQEMLRLVQMNESET